MSGEPAVTFGPVPDRLDGATHTGPLREAAPGRYLLRLPTVGGFLAEAVDGGVRVTVDRAPGATDADVACFLAGPVRQAGWLLRGVFALPGCGVVVGGRAVAIVGPAAAGKSLVAAALARRGHRVLADGALPVRIGAGPDGGWEPIAEPADDAVQLWPAGVEALGLDPEAGQVIRPGLAKRRYRFTPAPEAPLATVVALSRDADFGVVTAEPASGFAATALVAAQTAMRPLVEPFGLAALHFGWTTRLATAVRVVRVRSNRHRRDFAAVADLVEELLAPTGPVRAPAAALAMSAAGATR